MIEDLGELGISEENGEEKEEPVMVDGGESHSEDEDDETVEELDGDDEDDGWITPSNISRKKLQMNGVEEEELPKRVKVACLTTDFAMQVDPCTVLWKVLLSC